MTTKNCTSTMLLVGLLLSSTVLGKPTFVLVAGAGFKVEENELESAMQSDIRRAKAHGGDLKIVKQENLDALIEKKLLRLEAQRLGLMEAIQAKVESEMAVFRKRYDTDAARKAFYVNASVTEEILRKRYEEVAVLRRIEKEVGVRKPEAATVRRRVPSEALAKSDVVVIRELSISKGDENAKTSNEERQALAAEIAAKWGTDKEYVRKQLGKPELMGLIKLGAYTRQTISKANPEKPGTAVGRKTEFVPMMGSQETLPQELRAAAEKLKPGETSGVIVTEAGFHVLMAGMPDNSARDRRAKAAAEQKEKWDAYINELKKRYEVKIIAQPE